MNFLFCIPRDLHFFSFADWVSVARNLACLRLETLMSDLVKVTQDESVCDTLNIPRLCLLSSLPFFYGQRKNTHTISKIGLSFATTFTIVDTEASTLKFDEILA